MAAANKCKDLQCAKYRRVCNAIFIFARKRQRKKERGRILPRTLNQSFLLPYPNRRPTRQPPVFNAAGSARMVMSTHECFDEGLSRENEVRVAIQEANAGPLSVMVGRWRGPVVVRRRRAVDGVPDDHIQRSVFAGVARGFPGKVIVGPCR